MDVFLNSLLNDDLVRLYKEVKPLARGDQQKLLQSSPKLGLPKPTGLSGYLSRDGPHNRDAKSRALLIETLRAESHLIQDRITPLSAGATAPTTTAEVVSSSPLSSTQSFPSSQDVTSARSASFPWASPLASSSHLDPDSQMDVDSESLHDHEIRTLRMGSTGPTMLDELYMELGRLEYERRKIEKRIETVVAKISRLKPEDSHK